MRKFQSVALGVCTALALISEATSAEDRLVAIKSVNGSFLCAEGGGGSHLSANRPAQGPWERFTIVDLNATKLGGDQLVSGDRVCLRTDNGHFVVAEGGGGRETNANRSQCGPWETFTILWLQPTPGGPFPAGGVIPKGQDVSVAFMAENSNFMTAEGGGGDGVTANRAGLGPWERFTMMQTAIH